MKLSGIALLFLSLTNHSSPHLCTHSSQVQPEIIKPRDSLSTVWPVEKSLKLYCYHRCVSWRQAVVYWRWEGANFHWAEDSRVRPLLAVHKQEQTPCVCLHAGAHVGEKERACVSIGGHTQMWGESNLLLFSTAIPEVKTTKNATLHLLWETAKERKGNTDSFLARTITVWMKIIMQT